MSDLGRRLLEAHRPDLVSRVEGLLAHIVSEGADTECRRRAHALAGAALTVGLDGLAVAAAALEAACDPEGGDVAAARRALELALRELAGPLDVHVRHELRGGLNIVVGHASLLELEALAPLQRESVREIVAAAEAMARALDALEPGAAALPAPAAPVAPGGGPVPARRVLLVEDDPITARVVRRMLEELGAEVVVVGEAAEVVGTALAERPDLLLLDLHLSDADGREVLRAVRASPALAGLPVVVSSGNAAETLGRELTAAGATAVVPKPLGLPVLRALLRAGAG